uniref:Ras association domain family member 1 n=1 Tax=Anser brachyrhynchus TaxID=132585 RepID=A0A8B9B9D3_9AVES
RVKSPPETGPRRAAPGPRQPNGRGGAGPGRAEPGQRAGPRRAGQRAAGSAEPRLGLRQGPGRAEPRRDRATVPRRAGTEPSRAAPVRAAAPSRAEPQPKRSGRSGAVRSRAGAAGLARGRASPCARAGAAAVAGAVAGAGAGPGAAAGGCGAAAAALALRWGGAGGTGGSAASSGYCSQEDSDSEPELFYTARTSLGRRPRRRQDEPSSWDTAELDPAQVEQRIKEYNSQINSNLFMSLNKDGSYTGFIKVQLKLARPVSVPAVKRGPGGRPGQRGPGVKRRTSFYLPRGTVKHLHVLSHTRASEVISALLRKFTVVDDPRKFALFERSEKDEQVYLRKLSDEEQPLRLRLLAGPSEKALSFVLKENDTGEVNWDAFTLPELHNFLRILQREEDEQVRRVRHRYARCRREMQEALATRTPR